MNGQFEESEEIDVVAREFRIVRHKRQKYRCSCGECVETALGPDKLIAGGRYSLSFGVEVAQSKYEDHQPLARQVKQMRRSGLEVTSQTLWDQTHALAVHLRPSYGALRDAVLESSVIGMDETHWRLLEKGKTKKWWVWSLCSPQAVHHHIAASRGADEIAQLLGDYAGVVMCDGYAAYPSFARNRDGPGKLVLANCWSHARRAFVKAEPDYPKAVTCPLESDPSFIFGYGFGLQRGEGRWAGSVTHQNRSSGSFAPRRSSSRRARAPWKSCASLGSLSRRTIAGERNTAASDSTRRSA
jgi:transposase